MAMTLPRMTPPTRANVIAPQPGPQTSFLSCRADVIIYGGQAGGGKTWSLLLDPLRHISVPTFRGVIFRRVAPQITNPGGLWDESMTLYPLVGGIPQRSRLEWSFPGGAKIKFGHMQYEDDKLDWQGSQIPYVGWDEVTHFSEGQFFYLLTRQRTCRASVRRCGAPATRTQSRGLQGSSRGGSTRRRDTPSPNARG